MRYEYRVSVTPADVGSRVTLRARNRGPGPTYADTLGVLVSWADDVLTVERRDGSLATVAAADLVAGRVVRGRGGRR